ncbi:hypothetical protein K402DRAFT_184043 [Aulographum hederae CBS 113979]|uniref:Uncharacterized protein n=1 Tax=Aulographum hederae CBS 113979 TaxID=1176131 RepID=A0A6G1GQ62_9PEZI|nr:hypothetical protein K402DRAFT_184043 [Aulographum hederae CBS 113979]
MSINPRTACEKGTNIDSILPVLSQGQPSRCVFRSRSAQQAVVHHIKTTPSSDSSQSQHPSLQSARNNGQAKNFNIQIAAREASRIPSRPSPAASIIVFLPGSGDSPVSSPLIQIPRDPDRQHSEPLESQRRSALSIPISDSLPVSKKSVTATRNRDNNNTHNTRQRQQHQKSKKKAKDQSSWWLSRGCRVRSSALHEREAHHHHLFALLRTSLIHGLCPANTIVVTKSFYNFVLPSPPPAEPSTWSYSNSGTVQLQLQLRLPPCRATNFHPRAVLCWLCVSIFNPASWCYFGRTTFTTTIVHENGKPEL